MKILEITLKNLNSLRGEWKIDFSDPAYELDGIFSVTGPTGAGKTTIFDALCLALYGKTPRLTTNRKEDISEIMSKHTKYCMAKAKFEAGGKIYVCEWSMTKKADTLSTLHTIEEDGRKMNGALSHVAEITGLDFRRFTQAALLAQGEFDAFLSGSDTERAKILELLTGTGIYSEISASIALHAEKAKDKRDKIREKRDALTPNDDFGSDEELSQEIAETLRKISSLEAECSEIETILLPLRKIQELNNELSQNQQKIHGVERIIAASQDKRSRLESGIRARDILPKYESLSEKRRQYRDLQNQYENSRRESEEGMSKLARIESELLPKYEDSLRQLTRNIPEGDSPASIRTKVKSSIDESMRIYRQRTEFESERSKAEEELKKLQAALDSAKKDEDTARKNLDRSRERVSELMNMRVSATLNDKRRELKPGDICPLCGSVVNSQGLCSVSGNDTNNNFRFDDELGLARRNENEALRNSQEAEKKVSHVQSERDSRNTSLEHYRKSIIDCDERRLAIKSSVLEIIEPLGILGVKSCEEIIERVEKWYSEAVILDKKITDLNGEAQSLRGSAQVNSRQLEEKAALLSAMKKELETLEGKFRASLSAKNFTDEKHFTASILSDGEITEFQADIQRYDEEMKRLHAVRENIMKHLEEEKSKAVSDMTLEEANMLSGEKDNEIKSLRVKSGRLEEAHSRRKKIQSEREKLDAEYKSQEEKYTHWEAFNQRLGSKNGSKFGRFAQRITLRMLVQLSNIQLERMNSRYTLMLTPDDDNLKLSVKDSEQAGIIRPTSNLSGGEKFIISLALALGLSQISGSKAQVDSLFIDEGFGSLDEDSLNAALDALGEIKRDGRMIGIISHILGISERIPARISVIPKSEGTSIITGPGCSGSSRV